VSVQNFFPRFSQRILITLVSALATALALVLSFGSAYTNFLYLLGSVFIPLFGVLVADWLLAGFRYTEERIFDGPAWRPAGLAAWIAGFCLYQWLSPVGPGFWTRLVDKTHPGYVTFGASLPSFALSFVLMLVLTLVSGWLRSRLSGIYRVTSSLVARLASAAGRGTRRALSRR
jgi:purine-cytosine permease-like protein